MTSFQDYISQSSNNINEGVSRKEKQDYERNTLWPVKERLQSTFKKYAPSVHTIISADNVLSINISSAVNRRCPALTISLASDNTLHVSAAGGRFTDAKAAISYAESIVELMSNEKVLASVLLEFNNALVEYNNFLNQK